MHLCGAKLLVFAEFLNISDGYGVRSYANDSGRGRERGVCMYIISGRGRKSGSANALVALVRWAPLVILVTLLVPSMCHQ